MPVRILFVFGLLYLFMLAINMLGTAFELMGSGVAEQLFHATENPISGLMIGLLVTAIVQSSSTTTSLIVGLVGSGALSFAHAVPMIMGANIGTTVTNMIVSLGHISRGSEFKRAFAGSTVHDFFNLCTVIVILPLEMMFGIVSISAHIVEKVYSGFGGLTFTSPVKGMTQPVGNLIAALVGNNGWLVAIVAVVLLFIALKYIVTLLKAMVLSKVERFFQVYIFRTPALGLLLGIGLTVLVQSSSITTSLVVPLLAAGVVSLTQVYPYFLGANVGTTITAFLASFAVGSHEAVSIAFAHFLFNVYGIAIFWPLKKIPITLAQKLAEWTSRSRAIPFIYIFVVFFAIPGLILFFMG